jgi:hypothetical protein
MNEIEKKLNKEYAVRMQGGSILMLIKLLSEKLEKLDMTVELAGQLDIEVPGEVTQIIAALDAVGRNLAIDAREIFGAEYLDKVFRDDDLSEVIPTPTAEGSSAIN